MDQVVLDGGVDLSHASPATPAGKLRECFNYEVGWERGYARIDGFERFDGNTSPSSTTGWLLSIPTDDVTGTFTPPENLTWTDGDGNEGDAGTLVQTVVDDGNLIMYILFREGRVRPKFDDTITGDESGASIVLDNSIITVTFLENAFDTHGEYLDFLHDSAEILRNEVRPVPGGGTIVGIHWHEDSLYAIRDVQRVKVDPSQDNILQVGMYVYNDAGQVGEVIETNNELSTIDITPLTADGFQMSDGQDIHVALTVRFINGSGTPFPKDRAVLAAPSGWAGDAGYIDTREGEWSSDTGEGQAAFINGPDGVAAVGDVLTDQVDLTSNCEIELIYHEHQTSAVTVTEALTQSEYASLWRSTDDSWVLADSGRILTFKNGQNEPGVGAPVEQQDVMYPTEVSFWSQAGNAWVGDINTLKVEDAVTFDVNMGGGTPVGYVDKARKIYVRDFKFSVPNNAVVKGFQLGFHSQRGGGSASYKCWDYFRGSTKGSGATASIPDGALATSYTGNKTQTWNRNLTPGKINDPDWGFYFEVNGYSPTFVEVDAVKGRVTYDIIPGTTLYLYDPDAGVDIGQITIDETIVQEGDWDDNDAQGYFRLTDWQGAGVPAGIQIRSGPNGTGVLVAETASDITPVLLPGSLQLDENRSRYQMISYNFFASEEQNAIYGVNGAGPAFWYDGEFLDFILTGVPVEDDQPRHIAAHQHRLALGYQWGEVYVSAPGEPTNFNGVDFAASFGFGDKVTGLMPTVGDALAVFLESATWMLTGAAGDDSNPPRQQIVNARVGAIEYTVQSMGNRPIFASFRGIETLETTEQFGEFFTAPMTYDISPWLLERLQTAAGLEATDKSVVNSVVVRNKNQYRLFFADGFVMTLSQVGVEKTPQNTIQFYYFVDDQLKYARCFATASGVTSDGRDRAFYTVEERPNAPDEPAATRLSSPEVDFVYELDRGRSFDGGEIISWFTLTYNFAQQQQAPMLNKRYNVIQVHGKVPGFAELRLSRANQYEDLDVPPLNYEEMTLGSLTHEPEKQIKSKYTKGRLSGRGFAVSLRINHVSDREFPHVLQHITFLDDEPNRPNR